MRTLIEFYLLRFHGTLNKKQMVMSKEKFVEDMLKAHQVVLKDAWTQWQNVKMKPKLKLKKYPEGFYSFMVEYIENLLKENGSKNPVE